MEVKQLGLGPVHGLTTADIQWTSQNYHKEGHVHYKKYCKISIQV